jgi:chitin disaccharide deacetylase
VPSLAERLGFAASDKLVIVHADDVGLCHAQNVGFFDVLEAGGVTSGSVLVPCPWFPEAAAYARRRAGIDLGVHLCLNSEWASFRWAPLLGKERVPSLVDGDGYFWTSQAEALAHAKPEEAHAELRAQVDRALAAGIDVTHLDAHMGTAMMTELLSVYFELGLEFRLPVFFPRPTATLLEEVGHPELIPELDRILDELERSRVLMVDHAELGSLTIPADGTEEHYRQVIGELEPGVTHLIVHPARGDDELEAMSPETWRQREAEHWLFSSPLPARWLDETGAKRIGYRAIRDLVRA